MNVSRHRALERPKHIESFTKSVMTGHVRSDWTPTITKSTWTFQEWMEVEEVNRMMKAIAMTTEVGGTMMATLGQLTLTAAGAPTR